MLKIIIRRATLCSFLIILLGGTSVSWSDESSSIRLTLRDAVQLALKQNPQVQIAGINLAQSEQDKVLAWSKLLPQVGVQLTDAALRGNFEALAGRPIPLFPRQIGPFQQFQGGAAFSLPVFDLTLWRRWQAADYAAKGTAAQSQSVREQITLLVVSQYFGCLRAKAALAAAQSRVELAQALYKLASDLQENGVGTGIDTLRANVQLQAEKQSVIVVDTQLKTSLYGLSRLLNLDLQRKIELADEMKFLATPPNEAGQDLEQAYGKRPEMEALQEREMAVSRLKDAAGASSLPSVRATGSWAYQGLSVTNSIPIYEYRMTLSLPLFTGGQIKAERAKAELELKKVGQEKQELRNQITLQVQVARAELESARNEVEVANLALKLANEEVTQARDRFEAGVANNLEVVTAQSELARAGDSQINALYRYNQARADLARATGQMEALYSK